ncbi:MAG: DUF2330 domain-containing protein [Myxococcota bacterium]
MLLFWISAAAHAFCGNYVGEAGADLVNTASEVAIVRQGGRTTITMSNDVVTDVNDFAMIVPVPVVLGEEDVKVVDPDIFDALDGYSGPRLVTYTCEELYPETFSGGGGFGCQEFELAVQEDNSAGFDGGGWDVQIEEQFIVGEYEVTILSAEESSSLLSWLNDNGYAVADDARGLIQEYLDAGSYFFAAKVFLDRLPEDQDVLSPLRFSYTSDVFALPIRLGTLNSAGSQDLVAYVLTDVDAGRVGISNYPEAVVEDECLFEGQPEDFGVFYEDRFSEAVDTDEASWVLEYGWRVEPWVAACDPCPPTEIAEPMDVSELETLGFETGAASLDSGAWFDGPSYYFSRLRMRYTPEQATEDLVLYTSRMTDNTQHRYIQYKDYLEFEFPICGKGYVTDDPGSCIDVDRKYRDRMREAGHEDLRGCTTGGPSPWAPMALLAGALLIGLRRREAR